MPRIHTVLFRDMQDRREDITDLADAIRAAASVKGMTSVYVLCPKHVIRNVQDIARTIRHLKIHVLPIGMTDEASMFKALSRLQPTYPKPQDLVILQKSSVQTDASHTIRLIRKAIECGNCVTVRSGHTSYPQCYQFNQIFQALELGREEQISDLNPADLMSHYGYIIHRHDVCDADDKEAENAYATH